MAEKRAKQAILDKEEQKRNEVYILLYTHPTTPLSPLS
jgi:hypothetical protein